MALPTCFWKAAITEIKLYHVQVCPCSRMHMLRSPPQGPAPKRKRAAKRTPSEPAKLVAKNLRSRIISLITGIVAVHGLFGIQSESQSCHSANDADTNRGLLLLRPIQPQMFQQLVCVCGFGKAHGRCPCFLPRLDMTCDSRQPF